MSTTMTAPADLVTRPDWQGATPATEPADSKRAAVREWRRELAEWLRAHGVPASGAVWEEATTGERDLARLRRTAADDVDGPGLPRHWSGYVMPGGLAHDDQTDHGRVAGSPVVDPDTGTVWVVVTRTTTAGTDHDDPVVVRDAQEIALEPAVPVSVCRGKGTR